MPRLLIASAALAMLAGCTTYTWEDGRQETVWGVPAEDTTITPEAQGVQYRIPGEPPR